MAKRRPSDPYSSEPCTECGDVHGEKTKRGADRCQAHRKSDGKQCTQPLEASGVCHMHGANGDARAKRDREQRVEEVAQLARTLGVPLDVDAETGIVEEIKRTAGHIAWLREQIAELDPAALTWLQRHEERSAGRFQGRAEQRVTQSFSLQLHPLVTHYLAERKHFVDVCTKAVALGLHEREIRIVEEQASLMAAAMRALINDPELALNAQQKEIAKRNAPRHLRAVS